MNEEREKVPYFKVFWLFMIGSLAGVLIEGVFCVCMNRGWETHTVTLWGPFCSIYGLGAAMFYVGGLKMRKLSRLKQFVIYALVADVVEYACGALLKYGLGMKAWDYSGYRFNIDGIICLEMTFVWGFAGLLFAKFAIPRLRKPWRLLGSYRMKQVCVVLSVLMAVNFLVTGVCIYRWSNRHYNIPAKNRLEQYIDTNFDDDQMQNVFVEWKFLS